MRLDLTSRSLQIQKGDTVHDAYPNNHSHAHKEPCALLPFWLLHVSVSQSSASLLLPTSQMQQLHKSNAWKCLKLSTKLHS